ncbi:MAG: complex I NDUFA9 subunit family protein [Candidatus Zixiibacteriota bacterium]
MKIAVTGGTGFVGHHLVNKLLSAGHEVTVVTRRVPARDRFVSEVVYHVGSVDDTEALKSAFKSIFAVYHLVGIIAETKTNSFDKTVSQGTANVVQACHESSVARLIYLSAMGTSINAPTRYHRTKYLAEQAVIDSGLDFVIYRPSIIYGPGDGFVSLLTRMIKMYPVTPVIGSGKFMLQPVYIDDLVQAMAAALTNDRVLSQIIEIGGPEKLEYIEILNIIKRVLGKRRVNFHIPIAVMYAVASALEKILTPAPITRDQLKMMEMGNTGDITRMKELLSIEPIELEKGLRKYLRYPNG